MRRGQGGSESRGAWPRVPPPASSQKASSSGLCDFRPRCVTAAWPRAGSTRASGGAGDTVVSGSRRDSDQHVPRAGGRCGLSPLWCPCRGVSRCSWREAGTLHKRGALSPPRVTGVGPNYREGVQRPGRPRAGSGRGSGIWGLWTAPPWPPRAARSRASADRARPLGHSWAQVAAQAPARLSRAPGTQGACLFIGSGMCQPTAAAGCPLCPFSEGPQLRCQRPAGHGRGMGGAWPTPTPPPGTSSRPGPRQ